MTETALSPNKKKTPLQFQIASLCCVNSELKDLSYYIKDFSGIDNKITLSYSFEIELRSGKDKNVDLFIHIQGVYNDGEEVKSFSFLHYDVVTTFFIANFKDVVKNAKDNQYSIDIDHLITLVSIAFSNARGYIAASVDSVYQGKIVLPVIYPSVVVKNRKSRIKRNRYYFSSLLRPSLRTH